MCGDNDVLEKNQKINKILLMILIRETLIQIMSYILTTI
jgi:hypothetical protein